MIEQETTDVFLTFKFTGREIYFYNLEDLIKFNQFEFNGWSWLNTDVSDNSIRQVLNIFNDFCTAINNFINQYNQRRNNTEQISSIKVQLVNRIQHAINNGFILHDSPDGQFINQLKDSHGPLVAGWCLASLMKAKINFTTYCALEGFFWGMQYKQGNTETVTAIKNSLEITQSEWTENFSSHFKEVKNNNEILNHELDLLKGQHEELIEKCNDQLEKQAAEFNSQIREHEVMLNDITHTYDNKLALQSSVSYWKNKKKSHKYIMIWVGIVTFLFACATGVGFVWASFKLLQETINQAPFWKLGFMLAISSFGVWLTRLSAKIFISNLHLCTDSSERVTMIQTYLALLREGSGPKDDERQLILQTLFRPSSTGFVSEEGPTGIFEALIQRVSGK